MEIQILNWARHDFWLLIFMEIAYRLAASISRRLDCTTAPSLHLIY